MYIAREGVSVVNLFRRPGNPKEISAVIEALQRGRPFAVTDYSFYALANVVKVCVGLSSPPLSPLLLSCLFSPPTRPPPPPPPYLALALCLSAESTCPACVPLDLHSHSIRTNLIRIRIHIASVQVEGCLPDVPRAVRCSSRASYPSCRVLFVALR